MWQHAFNPTYYGPFGATPDIRGGHNVPPISYACSTCAIVMKLWEIKQLDIRDAHTNFQSSNVYCFFYDVIMTETMETFKIA